VVACVERAGGAVAWRERGLFDVLLPPELEAAVGRGLVRLAEDPAALASDPEAELATPGSPVVDELVAWAVGRGRVARARLPAGRIRRKGLREEVERALTFLNCRVRYEASEPEVLDTRYALFNFRVTYLSDEKRERCHAVPVNLWSNHVNHAIARRLEGLPAKDFDEPQRREAPAIPIDQAYTSACEALRRSVGDESRHHRARIEKRFGVEFARVCGYYDQIAHDLRLRRHADGPEAGARLERKLEATEADRQRKLLELGEKHRLHTRARLTSARVLVQAKTFFTLLLDRGPTTRRLTLCYDSWLERLEPPACDICRDETTRVHVTSDARMLCPSCLERR
jgi:hypothetical protein